MWRSYPASFRNLGGSTQVPVRAWNGTWGVPPPVKLERRQMTYTVSVWRKTQNKQTNKQTHLLVLQYIWFTLIIIDQFQPGILHTTTTFLTYRNSSDEKGTN
jgi:hypothetical protein